jgi:V/A-type H+-transporting ATPase subunit I
MGLCFLIGAVQLSIGHLWNVIELAREKSLKALEQLGWTLTTWFMFFLADDMVIGGNMSRYLGSPDALKPFTGSAVDYAVLAGVGLILFFMMKPREIKDGWFNLVLLPLNLIGNFTDVVSYVRLFAVGTAGFAVAAAFNTMIFGGEVTLLGGLIGAVLAFLAHTLNILLCVMGVLVHGIRLNTLEFSNHKGISWSGAPYRPFAKRETAA